MAPETENKSNPWHNPETNFEGETTFITEDPPGGLPLDSAEVIEREKKRREELVKEPAIGGTDAKNQTEA